MKTLRKMKKGFTIVELVIVIAVIAVLTAILVPTFISISNKADKASDQSLKVFLNNALALVENDRDLNTNGANVTMQHAIEDLDVYGIALERITTKSDEKLVWKLADNRFYFESDESVVADSNKIGYWRIQDKIEASQSFSVYAGPGFNASIVNVDGVGFDSGYKESIETINYTNSGSPKTVIIRSNSASTTVNVDADSDTVNLYGLSGSSKTERTADNSVHLFGTTGYAQIASGRLVAESGSDTNTIVLTEKGSGATLPAVIQIKNGAEVEKKYATNNAVATANNGAENSTQLDLNPTSTEGGEVLSGETLYDLENDARKSVSPDPYADAPEDACFAYVAPNGDVYYSKSELDEAIAGNEFSIVLLKDTTNPFAFIYNSNFTFDLNGHTLDLSSESDGFGAVESNIVLTDSKTGGTLKTCAFEVMYDGSLVVEGGLTLFSGTSSTPWGGQMAEFDLAGPITCRGGKFNSNPAGHIASGYHAVENAGIWSVIPD